MCFEELWWNGCDVVKKAGMTTICDPESNDFVLFYENHIKGWSGQSSAWFIYQSITVMTIYIYCDKLLWNEIKIYKMH